MDLQFSENRKTINYYEYAVKRSLKTDIEIVVKDKVIQAHKQILGLRSPIFLDKFTSQPDLTTIEITDLDPTSFRVFVDYLYTGEIAHDNVTEDLFLVARRYLDPTLINICRKRLGENLTMENVVMRLTTFFDCDEEKLVNKACMFVATNYNDVKIRPEFKLVLKRPKVHLAIVDVFDFCNVTVLSERKYMTQKSQMSAAYKSDLTIKVQNDSFLVRKDILASRNTVFRAAITALSSNYITIPDSSPQTFKLFLRHVYNHSIIDREISEELLKVAYKYEDKRLQKLCEDRLMSTICEANAVKLLILSVDVACQRLEEKSSRFIAENFDKMNVQADFEKHRENPKVVTSIFKVLDTVVKKKVQNEIKSAIDTFNVQKNTASFTGKFSLKVPLNLGETFITPSFFLKNISWHIYTQQKIDNFKTLGIFFGCNIDKIPFSKKICLSLRLISSVGNECDIFKSDKSCNLYNADPLKKTIACGWSNFVSWTDLNDVKKGFLKDGFVNVEIDVKILE